MTQFVKLDLNGRAYTYAWNGDEPLRVGDEVRCPGNSVNPKEFTARVLRLLPKSDWDGEVTEIIDVVVSDEQIDHECICSGPDVDDWCPHHGVF